MSSVASRPPTSASVAPATASRPASTACVTGRPCAIVLIQPGRSSSGTLTPQKMRSTAKTRFEKTASSRTRSETAACASPSAVHEKAAAAIVRTSRGSDRAASSTSRTSAPNAKLESETTAPLARDRMAHREEPRQRRELDRVADDVERVVLELGRPAEVGEEEHLEQGRHDHRRHEQGRVQPAEEAAEAEQPPEERNAERRHVSESVARRRADSRKRPSSIDPTTV